MKNIFKKISAIAASALMVGMTMGVAAATTYPAPFVEGGSANVAIVYGTGTGVNPSDYLQAGFIQTNLASGVVNGGTPSGDNILLQRDTDFFNLMNNMSSFYSKLDEGELINILAKGVYSNDAHDDFKYTQEIVIAPGIQLKHFLDSKFNDDKPVIGFDLASGTHLLNYTLKFTPDDAEGTDSSWGGITDSELPLFSTPYYVLAMSNTSNTNHKITLLNSATSATLNKGESVTLTIDTASYVVSISYMDGSNIKLIINDEITDKLIAGQTQKLKDGSYVGIKDVASEGVDGAGYVEFSIGTGKLVLENGKEVEINNEKLSRTKYAVVGSDDTVTYKVTSYISTVGWNIDNIVLDWELDDESWLVPGTEMTLPGFETIKLSMSEFVTSVGEVTTFEGDSSKFEISTIITDGAITLPIFYMNSTSNAIGGLGKDSTHVLTTGVGNKTVGTGGWIQIALNESKNSFFVVTWIDGDDFESYAYELSSVEDEGGKNTTILDNLVTTGGITLDEVGAFETEGNIKFTLSFAEEKHDTYEYVILNITAATSGTVYTNRLVTADGLMMMLPVENSTGNDLWETASTGYKYGIVEASGVINTSASTDGAAATSWIMNVTEEDKNENIGYGKSFEITFAIDSTDGLEVSTITHALTSSTMYETEDGSKLYEGYVPSDLSTKLLHHKPTSGLSDLKVTYFGSETYAKVYLTESGSVMEGTGTLGEVRIMDSEVSSFSSKHLIVVGGSCINSAAATLIGSAACTADWTAATGVGAGEFLIQSFGDAYTTGKIALLVAGYNAADTANAVTYLKTQTIDTTAGKKYKGTSSTSAELVVV